MRWEAGGSWLVFASVVEEDDVVGSRYSGSMVMMKLLQFLVGRWSVYTGVDRVDEENVHLISSSVVAHYCCFCHTIIICSNSSFIVRRAIYGAAVSEFT